MLLAVWEKGVARKVRRKSSRRRMFFDDDSIDRKAFSPLALRTGTDGRNERWPKKEMVGLRDGQRDLAGMNDGLNKRRPEGIRVSENWL